MRGSVLDGRRTRSVCPVGGGGALGHLAKVASSGFSADSGPFSLAVIPALCGGTSIWCETPFLIRLHPAAEASLDISCLNCYFGCGPMANV